MISLKLINNLRIKAFLLLFLILFSKSVNSSENKIIFKINNNAYTTIDLEVMPINSSELNEFPLETCIVTSIREIVN